VLDIDGGPIEAVQQMPAGTITQGGDLVGASEQATSGFGQSRPGPQSAQHRVLAVEPVSECVGNPDSRSGDAVEFLGNVRHHSLRGVRRGGRAHIRNQIDERRVALVADRADDRSGGSGDGTDQRLVRERQ
jgi:hypothetical protein